MSDRKGNKRKRGGRSRLAPACLIVLILGAFVFLFSDAAPVRGVRDALFGRLGYVAEDGPDGSEVSGEGSVKAGESKTEGEINDAASPEGGTLPEYDGQNYVSINGNVPEFPDEVYERAGLTAGGGRPVPYEYYGSMDGLGRCTEAFGCLGEETMPADGEKRGDISAIHPSGWAKAQNWERCHLIAWALSAENANPENLITGTHYLNYDGMRPVEEKVERYIRDSGNHVLYMVKPWFSGDELVARGVQMSALSVEDGGSGISFNIYCFNVTPGAEIDYRSGIVTTEEQAAQPPRLYVVNRRSGVFHYPSCEGVRSMNPENREELTASRSELISRGYTPCGYCEP